MSGEWRHATLGDVLVLKRGFDLPERDRRPGNVPIISSSGLTGWHSDAPVRGPGVVTGRYGTIGQVFFVDQDYWPLNTTLYVSDFRGNHPRFISYFLKLIKFSDYSDKGAVPGVNRNHLHMAPVVWPSRLEQDYIADLLGALDDKIELNRRIAESLEAIARALFKSWFVDFDLIHFKTEGPSAGLPDDLVALFPTRFGEEGLPEGWATMPLNSIVTPERAGIEPSILGEQPVDHFSLPAFDAGRQPQREAANLIKSLKLSVRPPVVLFSKLNPEMSRVWPVLMSTEHPMLASTEFLILKPKAGFATLSFVTSLLLSDGFRERAAGMVTGTSKSHQRVQPASLLATSWPTPSQSVMRAFDDVAAPLLARSDAARRESDSLASLRDTLLPKLISGKLRIRDAERVVAAA